MITAGQAFHWFDQGQARREFARILKPDGWVVLAWNIARTDTPFMAANNQRIWQNFLAPPAGSAVTNDQAVESELRAWYTPGIVNFKSFESSQVVDFNGLRGRILSSSYSPTPEDPRYASMLKELEAIFHEHQVDGKVSIEYECRICYGQSR